MDTEQPSLPVSDQLIQLRKARSLVLRDAVFWPQIFQGVLPIVSGPYVELRRWGAEFLAETFSTPTLDEAKKTELALLALDTLVGLIHEMEADLLKNAVQASASIYPLLFRYICTKRNETNVWQKVCILKQKILELWDSGPAGVKICCIKFVQRVIQVQTPGVSDPRLASRSEISLATVPPNHPLLSIPTLEAEAQGLLDRLLGVFHEDPIDPLTITSTLNCISILLKTRASLCTKIINAVLSFNPLSLALKNPTPKSKLLARCIEKTVRVLLLNLIRPAPNGPHVPKMTQHLLRLNAAKAELFDDASRKRPAVAPPAAQALDSAKRQRTEVATLPVAPGVAPGRQMLTIPKTYADLYTLTTDAALTGFDVQQLPLDIVVQITLATFIAVNTQALDAAVAAVKDRLQALAATQPASQIAPADIQSQQQQQLPPTSPPTIPTPPAQALIAAAPAAQQPPIPDEKAPTDTKSALFQDFDDDDDLEDTSPLQPFHLAPPPYPTDAERYDAAKANIDRMFGNLEMLEKTPLVQRKNRGGVMRVAAGSWDRDGWVTLITRLATRGLGACDVETKADTTGELMRVPSVIALYVRGRLFQWVMGDFRQNLDSAVAWLYEEWYNDSVMSEQPLGEGRVKQYPIWLMKVVDGILPFVEAKDRLVIRFLSEVPELNREVLGKVKVLCLDPDRSALGMQILHYNAMLRPPVREMCCDLFEDFYYHHKELANQASKLLERWRPLAIQPKKEDSPHKQQQLAVANGVKSEDPRRTMDTSNG